MPRSHRKYAEWTPERLISWAAGTGKATAQVVSAILSRKLIPEHGFNSCLGIISLGKRFSKERLEAACERALYITIEKLNSMKLTAMAKAFADQMQCPDMAQLTFEERFGLIVDYQITDLENRRMQNRLKNAKLRLAASIEDLDFRQGRGMDRSTIMSLAGN